MSIENPTLPATAGLVHFRHFSSLLTIEVEDPALDGIQPLQVRPLDGLDGMNHLTIHKHRVFFLLSLASWVLSLASCVLNPLHLSRTLYKSALFMQNKPNFDKGQNKPNPLYKKDLRKFYAPSDNEKRTQNEPNQTQFPKSQNEHNFC